MHAFRTCDQIDIASQTLCENSTWRMFGYNNYNSTPNNCRSDNKSGITAAWVGNNYDFSHESYSAPELTD